MKLIRYVIALACFSAIALSGVSNAHAWATQQYAGLWDRNDSNVNSLSPLTIYNNNCTMDESLYLNSTSATTQDPSQPGNFLMMSLVPGTVYTGADLYFNQNGDGSWEVTDVTTSSSTGTSTYYYNIGFSDHFGLYYAGASGDIVPYVLQLTPDNSQWQLTDGDPSGTNYCDTVYVIDAAPVSEIGSSVPVPSSALLFGSGLAGVLGFLRRFRS